MIGRIFIQNQHNRWRVQWIFFFLHLLYLANLQAETFLLPGKSRKISPPASSSWMQSKSLRCKNWNPRINRICFQAGNLVWAVYLFTYSICIATYIKSLTLGGEQSSKQTNLVCGLLHFPVAFVFLLLGPNQTSY